MSGGWRGGYIVSRGVREWGTIRVIKQAIYMWWRLVMRRLLLIMGIRIRRNE